jgi:hypothetical protein
VSSFIHNFIEVHFKQAAQYLHDPIQCKFSSAVILYLHDVHKKWVQQYACVIKINEHHIPPLHELGLQACSHGCGQVKTKSHKLNTCFFILFISSNAFAITGKALRTSSTMCSKFSHCCQNPSSWIVALIAPARA